MRIKIKRKIDKESPTEKIIDYLLVDRGIKNKKEFLNPCYPDKIKFSDIFLNKKSDLVNTIKLLKELYSNKKTIIVYTDYDADGLTGGAILWETLHFLGFQVMPYVPDRKTEGYGLSKKGIDNIKKLYNPALVITVDHGIVGHEKISYAKKLGIKIIVTDHHTQKQTLPKDAYAIFHTNQLSGSGVSYFFSREIFKYFQQSSNRTIEQLKNNFQTDYLSLASIGTIADMVPLVGVSRSIVKHGFDGFSSIKRIGIREILKEAGILDRKITSYEIGYIIAPRLNAFGRLAHGIDALRLLCTAKKGKALDLAIKAGKTNRTRQDLVEKTLVEAEAKVKVKDNIIVITDDNWQEGIIGLIASRLTEKYFRPSIIITKSDGIYKASARSIKSIDITKFLRNFSDDVIDIGGHPQAAGFSVDKRNLSKLIVEIKKKANKDFNNKLLHKKLYIDLSIPLSMVSLLLAKKLEKLAPFGVGNPNPVFYSSGKLIEKRLLGKDSNHLKIKIVDDNHNYLDVIYFNQKESWNRLNIGSIINIIYQLQIDRWGGQERVKGLGKYII